MLTFRSESCKVTKEIIEEEFVRRLTTKELQDKAYQKVKIQVLDMQFFVQDKQDYITFVKSLVGLKQQLYASPLIESLLD